VDVAAYAALRGILKADRFGPLTVEGYYHGCYEPPTQEERRAIAAEIRRRWERIKGLKEEETWLAVLADPTMPFTLWLDAAQKIITPIGSPRSESAKAEDDGVPIVEDVIRPLAGELLRGMKNPSVTELLVRRSDESAKRAWSKDSSDLDWRSLCKLTYCLGKWDPKAAVPAMRRRLVDLRLKIRDDSQFFGQELQYVAPLAANMVDAGLQAGEDDLLIRDYAAWLYATSPSDVRLYFPLVFLPLWRHPDNPGMVELARWLFLAADSPWRPILTPQLDAEKASVSPLIGIPAFREFLKRGLADTSIVGDFQVTRESVSFNYKNGGSSRASGYMPDVDMPKPDAKQPLRACDFYATKMSRLEGSPRYEMYWPPARRDAVLKDMARFLDQWVTVHAPGPLV
jgi:hypothetical protein